MLFNSHEFLFGFFPFVLAIFFVVGSKNPRAAAGWLGLASLFFYGWWSVTALPLLIGSIVFNFEIARRMALRAIEQRKNLLRAGVILNLGLLGLFKYADFFISNLNTALSPFTAQSYELLHLTLPIGISFYTFTQIAFLVDTAEGKANESSFLHYLLFVTYFPHLIAGPVLHHAQMMPQFARQEIYRIQASKIAAGLMLFTIGLSKKLILADPLGAYADLTFGAMNSNGEVGQIEAWISMTAYALQIYFDFSGYSDMAVGISLCLGVRLPENFNSPYRSTSIIEFWRRWHISLSNFLRDYLYIRLGGNRKGLARRHVNLALTMVLGGLWHGASWNFALWGTLHGLYLILNHGWRAMVGGHDSPAPHRTKRLAGQALTFLLVCLAWIPFRSTDLASTLDFYRILVVGDPGAGSPFSGYERPFKISTFYQTLIIGCGIAWFSPNSQEITQKISETLLKSGRRSGIALLCGAAFGVLFAVCVARLNQQSAFLYFQF